MAYNYSPITYQPFSYTGNVGPRQSREETWGDRTWTESPAQYSLRQQGDVTGQYRDYSADQFNSLFDAVNKLGTGLSSYTSGQAQEQQAALAQKSELARQAFQASLPQAPQMNFQQSPQPIYTGGGWGQQSPMVSSTPMTYRNQAPSGMLGTTNRGSHGGILGGSE